MKAFNSKPSGRLRSAPAVLVLFVFVLALLFLSQLGLARTQDGRPRTTQATVKPSATATPAAGSKGQGSGGAEPAQSPGRTRPTLGEAPPPPVLKPKPTPDMEQTFGPEGGVIRVDSALVNLNVRVIDRNNRPIDRIHKDEFHVFEDGVPQQVFSLNRQEVPVTYGLAVDTSGSLRTQLTSVIDAAKTIVNSNKSGDETFIERFISSDKIETLQDFTSSKDQLMDALENLYVEGGQTAVVDGVYLAAEHVAEYKKAGLDDRRRRALIVITDGEDRNSYYKETQLFQRLREEDVQIFVIAFVNELDKDSGFIRKSPREKAVGLINKLAGDTGGRAFFPQSLADLPGIANDIVRDLRTQYVVSYDPSNKAKDGTYRAVRVTVDDGPNREKRIALTRAGYVAQREGAVPKSPAARSAVPRQ